MAGESQDQRSGGSSFKLKRKARSPFRRDQKKPLAFPGGEKMGLRSPVGPPLAGLINWVMQSL